MNLLYIIPTRARPLECLSVVMTAWRLRSGGRKIEFAVVQDSDYDNRSLGIVDDLQRTGVHAVQWCAARPDALGCKWNHPLKRDVPGVMSDPDAALLMTDRMIPITPGWDEVIARCLELPQYANRVMWWRGFHDPGTVAPIVPRAWLKAMDWKPAVELYPYWFIDTHLMELDRLIFGGPSLIVPATYAGERKRTMELRDVGFWCRYYAARRAARIVEARNIACSLDVPWVERPELIAEFQSQDAMRLARAAEFEAALGDSSEPWDGYRRIKAKAEAEMGVLRAAQ